MPRFYFHFASRDLHIPDDHGVELPDAATAARHAALLVRQTRPFVLEGPSWEGWVIEIADEKQRLVQTVVFPDRRPALPPVKATRLTPIRPW
jgi:hypothetical protein